MTECDLDHLEEVAQSPRKLSLLRIEKLSEDNIGEGLAKEVVAQLEQAVTAWLATGKHDETALLLLRRLLHLLLHLIQSDANFGDELAREGSHRQLLRLMQVADDTDNNNHDEIISEELQDLAYEIGAYDPKFPQKVLPYSLSDLRARLPLVFTLPLPSSLTDSTKKTNTEVLIHQVTSRQSAQADVGFVMWPSSVVLARWLSQNANLLEGKRILELGSGCGLVGLSVALLLQHQQQQSKVGSVVRLTDFNPIVLDNLKRSIALNNLNCKVQGLDFYDQSGTAKDGWIDMEGTKQDPVDLIVAADIICQDSDAYSAAKTIHDALTPGGLAIVVCPEASQRFGVQYFVDACQAIPQLAISVQTLADEDGELGDLEQTSGFVPGMRLSLFKIQKTKEGNLSIPHRTVS